MPKYEIEIDDANADVLNGLAEARKTTVPNLIRDVVLQIVGQIRNEALSEEFKRLVEESITDNEPVLRRFAR